MAVVAPGLILPSDVLIIVMESLEIDELLNLACTCKFVNLLVHEFGWSLYLKRHDDRPSFTLKLTRKRWSPLDQVRYLVMSDRCWNQPKFYARPLSHPWHSKLQPILALSASMLLVAAGLTIYVYRVTDSFSLTNDGAPGMSYEGSYSFTDNRSEITSLTFIPCDHSERMVAVGFENGRVDRVLLLPFPKAQDEKQPLSLTLEPTSTLTSRAMDLVESLSCSDNMLLSLSSSGTAGICNLSSESPLVGAIDLDWRSWTSFLCMQSSTPFAAFGTTSPNPLVVHAATPAGLSPTPFAILHSTRERSTAVYGITGAPPSAPWGSSRQVIVSGWYDGAVRVHDMRSARRSSGVSGSPAPLRPMLTLRDPWSDEPIYSVSCGGGSSSFVAAGTALHSVVAFWDVRRPTEGWSVHAPGNDSSPVYSLILESSRLFGVTQSRPFVFDFGPGVTKQTYPSLPHRDSLQLNEDGIGYRVAEYNHSRR